MLWQRLGLITLALAARFVFAQYRVSHTSYGQQRPSDASEYVYKGSEDFKHLPVSAADVQSALSELEFTKIGHRYIDVEARHLFFYFFESRSNPELDDVIYWTNGGPGCSSSVGLLMELGPCRVLDDEGPKFHPESWNSNANVLFVDQPVGVGFSYAEHGTVTSTADAAKDIAAFMVIFFEYFSTFRGRALHMAGESYGGQFIPVFASTVYDQNTYLSAQNITPINIASIMIGNGATDVFTMLPAYETISCTHSPVPPILSIQECVKIKQLIPRCEKWIASACQDQFDAIDCDAAVQYCRLNIALIPILMSGKNPYDRSKNCSPEELESSLCYPTMKYITQYLDKPEVRDLLGVDVNAVPSKFSACNSDITTAFSRNLDDLHSSVDYVAALLERGVRVLIYVGTYDWSCNWIGNEKWTLQMEWSGKEEFSKLPLREWTVDGAVAGRVRSAKGLTFLTIEGAGHMAPFDKPKETLEMVKRWISRRLW
ncbi:hypothetical protein ONZ45_g10765 [Pleurotus djamor]|nr:hypothetical protein ONZ45_g10765 [Pleurotus djamor]